MAVPFLACMALVAQVYSLPPRVLPSIQAVEGGGPGIAHLNTDGSQDLGVMQVNTQWVPRLAAYSRISAPLVRERLLNEPCYNIAAAGLIMRTYLDEAGQDLMRAVGNYHSHTTSLHMAYRERVMRSASALFGPRPH